MMVVAAKVARVMVVNVVENTVKLCSIVFKRLTVFAVIAKRRYYRLIDFRRMTKQ